MYLRSRSPGIVAVQSHDVPMLGGLGAKDDVFPSEVEVRYRGTPVSRLTSSTVWIWNAGLKTVNGEDIVPHDPLRLHFGGEVLSVRIIKTNRKVSRLMAEKSEDVSEEGKRTVYCSFDFLDRRNGSVLEVLHSGSARVPKCAGTIRGLPEGIQNWGPALTLAISRWKLWYHRLRFLMWMILIPAVLIVGPIQQGLTGYSWIGVVIGVWFTLVALGMFQMTRRQPPSSLDVKRQK